MQHANSANTKLNSMVYNSMVYYTNVTHANVTQFYDILHKNVTHFYGILHTNVTQVVLWSQTGSLTPSPDYWDQKVELCQFAPRNLSCCHWSGLWDNLKFNGIFHTNVTQQFTVHYFGFWQEDKGPSFC